MSTRTCTWRTLALLLASLAAAGCGPDPNGPGSYHAVMQAQKEAEDKLTAHGGKLERKEYPPYGSAWVIDLSGKEINDDILAALKGLDHIAELNLSGSTLSDAHIGRVNDLGMVLINLNLSKTSITDQGMGQLVCGFLKVLDVSGTPVTDAGVKDFLQKRAENKDIGPDFKKVAVKR